jgi:tRNA modification GTPase
MGASMQASSAWTEAAKSALPTSATPKSGVPAPGTWAAGALTVGTPAELGLWQPAPSESASPKCVVAGAPCSSLAMSGRAPEWSESGRSEFASSCEGPGAAARKDSRLGGFTHERSPHEQTSLPLPPQPDMPAQPDSSGLEPLQPQRREHGDHWGPQRREGGDPGQPERREGGDPGQPHRQQDSNPHGPGRRQDSDSGLQRSRAGWGEDTIVAISTAMGPGAIGIVRMSGPESLAIAQKAFRPARGEPLQPHESYCLLYGHVCDPADGECVDEALMAVMRAPRSYTREDVVEFHCHGGLAAQRAVLRLMVRLGARPAEPGEFTKRAFLNGRIDLAQAESVAAIVAARSSGALRASMRQLEGGLSARLSRVRHHLLSVLAQLEATLDFSDEDIELIDWELVGKTLRQASDDLKALMQTAYLGRALEQGVRTAIVGRPNVGKSSLLNALLMRERAIVSDVPGTTRDTVEELLEIGGIPIHLVDTAGIRAGVDHVERLGVERSVRAMEQADLVLAVLDLSAAWTEEDRSLVSGLDPARTIIVANKADLVADCEREMKRLLKYLRVTCEAGPGGSKDCALPEARRPDGDAVVAGRRGVMSGEEGPCPVFCVVSALTGSGLDALRMLIQRTVCGGEGLHFEEPVLANERQVALVSEANEAIEAAMSGVGERRGEELICEDVRRGIQALGRITGEDLTVDLLDEIFGRFCIGK